MSFSWLRTYSWLNRFGNLRRVNHTFSSLSKPFYKERSLFGCRIKLNLSRSTAQQLLFLEGERFIDERFLLFRYLHKGMNVVDIGANIGYYLLLFENAVGSQGHVVCVEPSEENLLELESNIHLNGFANVVLHKVAVGKEEGTVGLHSGINSGVVEAGGGKYQVPVRRLDSLVSEKVDFLKIDVEGYEGQVLEGAINIIQRDKPTIFLELHPHIVPQFGFSTRGIIEQLQLQYQSVTLYEKEQPQHQSLLGKIAVRYLGKDPVYQINDPESYIDHYDTGKHVHTFWAVCK